MYEYKVLSSVVRGAEEKFNELGKDGWRLVRTEIDLVGTMIAIFEREIKA